MKPKHYNKTSRIHNMLSTSRAYVWGGAVASVLIASSSVVAQAQNLGPAANKTPALEQKAPAAGVATPIAKDQMAQKHVPSAQKSTDSTLATSSAQSAFTNLAAAEVRSSKPDPNQHPQAQKTELKVSLCWETMNKDNKNAFVKGDSDFGQLNFESWDFGSTLDSSRQDVKNAFKNIEFQIKDTTTGEVTTTKGDYPDTATSATKSLGSYDSTHTYEVSVVNSTIPSPYYVTYNNVSTNEDNSFNPDFTSFTWTPSNAKDKQSQNKYFRLCVMEIVYAKDESVAANCFSYEQPKNADSSYRSDGNWKFTYNSDNIFARLRVKDNKIQFPETNPVKSGYKFAGWQFYVARKNNGTPYLSSDRMFDDDKKIINSTTVAYSPFGVKPYIDYPYLFALIRDSKGVNVFGSKLGTQYCSTNHTFVVFPKWEASGYKVTFMNGDAQLAQVKVQENKAIETDEWTDQSMPAQPTKAGFTFKEWNTKPDGTGQAFSGTTLVQSDMKVYAIYSPNPAKIETAPVLTLQDKTITEGTPFTVRDLIVSATDAKDGNLIDKVVVVDTQGFDTAKVGTYTITFKVANKLGISVTKSAVVNVVKKDEQKPTDKNEGKQEKTQHPSHLKTATPQTGDGLLLPISALATSLGFAAGLMGARLRRKH
ncbi:InlB B-repeat-containing protein [Fannyhessea vaginae]|uniref:InlB B-repeat-containing protein n=1 Tax=Fannyhessea vaginae TaxID=82135 RepID=UPI003A811316